MLMITDPANCRRIALHYNFHRTQDVYFDEWESAVSSHTLRIANKHTALNILIKFDPTKQNSGAE